MLTFTGSPAVRLGAEAEGGRKKVALELGGNAAAVVHRLRGSRLRRREGRAGGFGYAGQSCISVQRVLCRGDPSEAASSIWLLQERSGLRVGDPADGTTNVGPMIAAPSGARGSVDPRGRGGRGEAAGRRLRAGAVLTQRC